MITVLRLNEINNGPNTHTMHDTGAKDIAGSETGTKGQVCRRGRGRGEAGSRESIGFDERILRTCKQRKKSLAVRCTLLYIETVYIVDGTQRLRLVAELSMHVQSYAALGRQETVIG